MSDHKVIIFKCPFKKSFSSINLDHQIHRILFHSTDYHFPYQQTFLNYIGQDTTSLLTEDLKRISLTSNSYLSHPKYLFISLFNSPSNTIGFGIYDRSKFYHWTFKNHHIINNHSKLFLNIKNNKLVSSTKPLHWEVTDEGFLKTVNLYLSLDINYQILLTKNKSDAAGFHFEDNGIHYIKSPMRVNFEINNIKNSIDPLNIYKIKEHLDGIHIGILLAAGSSSRFNLNGQPKQLYQLEGIPLLLYSINVMKNVFDQIVIVTNTNCLEEIKELIKEYTHIKIIVNDINCRLESIETAFDYIHQHFSAKSITVHDSARPFVPVNYFQMLLKSLTDYSYSQYSLELVNGLAIKSEDTIEPIDRSKYLEICTPISAHFNLYYFIFKNYISKKNRIVHEPMPIFNLLKIKYNLIKGSYKYLRKITFTDDL